uniref:Uncharacterized protein n=1 Tax=Sphaerodactylus townsendi TaxID=933632 RepID=A0ACB8EQU4_9SAUR
MDPSVEETDQSVEVMDQSAEEMDPSAEETDPSVEEMDQSAEETDHHRKKRTKGAFPAVCQICRVRMKNQDLSAFHPSEGCCTCFLSGVWRRERRFFR